MTPGDARELENLGYGTLWLGGSPPAELPVLESLLAATETQLIGTSIVNIWSAPAKQVAESFHRLEDRSTPTSTSSPTTRWSNTSMRSTRPGCRRTGAPWPRSARAC